LCTAKYPAADLIVSPNVAAAFIDHSSGMWNFHRDRPVVRCPCSITKGDAMKKTLMALAAVATLAVSALAPAPAHAQRWVPGVAAGLIGGAIVGGAIASQNPYYYGPGYGYYGGPAYVASPGYYDDGCTWRRQRFWDGYGWRIRNVRVCY
jgi:hypothetical protein